MMSFPIALVLLFELTPKSVLVNSAVIFGMAIWVWMGLVEYKGRSDFYAANEEQYNDYLLSIYDLVPAVRPDTWFVMIDFGMGNTGCGSSLSALYQVPDLLCARLSTTDPSYMADRHSGDILNVRNTGGWIRNGNLILLAIDPEGEIYIIPSIGPEDNIYINWYSADPVETDYRRIVTDSSSDPSPMVLKLMERQKALERSSE